MVSITQKTRENISLAVSSACLLISALWIYYHATLTGDTNLSELTGFYVIMWGSSLPFGGMFLGPYIAPAVAALAGFFSIANYWHTDRPFLRALPAQKADFPYGSLPFSFWGLDKREGLWYNTSVRRHIEAVITRRS